MTARFSPASKRVRRKRTPARLRPRLHVREAYEPDGICKLEIVAMTGPKVPIGEAQFVTAPLPESIFQPLELGVISLPDLFGGPIALTLEPIRGYDAQPKRDKVET